MYMCVRAHTLIHTHTHSHTHSRTRINHNIHMYTLTLTHSLTHTHTLSHTHRTVKHRWLRPRARALARWRRCCGSTAAVLNFPRKTYSFFVLVFPP